MASKLVTQRGWEARVRFVFDSARTDKMTWPQVKLLCDTHIYAELTRRKGDRHYYGQYIQGMVTGMLRAYQNIFFEQYVEFCYLVDGALYTVNRGDTLRPHIDMLFETGRASELNDAVKGFYWKTEDTLYFATEDPNKVAEVGV